jgi:lipoprotein-releasing system permease protein
MPYYCAVCKQELPAKKHRKLNTELFIARKVFSQKDQNSGVASKIVSIAVGSISLGLAVMIISVAILLGFKKQIKEKAIGFGAHYQVVNYDNNLSYETSPIVIDSTLIAQYLQADRVKHLQQYATKPGLIKTDTEIHGMVLKGVCHNYNWDFFAENLVDGVLPQIDPEILSPDVLISERVSKLMQLKVGDPLYCYFYNEGDNTPRNRRFIVSGIYRTSMNEFDDLFVIGDLKEVQRLNAWHSSEITGYELYIDNFDFLEPVYHRLKEITLNNASETSMLKVYSIDRKYTMLFDWLSVLDMNVWVLLVLMVAVAGINMVSGLLIIIVERTRMIGILKALGYPNISIRKVFMYLTALLTSRGLLWGNIAGIGLCVLQYYTGFIKLDPASYYIDTVPILINPLFILLLNAGTLVSIVVMIILPSMFVSKITPVEAISFE